MTHDLLALAERLTLLYQDGDPDQLLDDTIDALREVHAEMERLKASERSAWNAAVVQAEKHDAEVERLRDEAANLRDARAHDGEHVRNMRDRMERLRSALDRIQGMCAVKDACECGRPRGIKAVRHCAVRALAGEKHD